MRAQNSDCVHSAGQIFLARQPGAVAASGRDLDILGRHTHSRWTLRQEQHWLGLHSLAYITPNPPFAMAAAHGFERAYWMAYFTGWSFCLVITSTVLGVAVSLKYLITCHHLSRVVVHGRPGLALHDNRPQHASDSVASTSAVTLDDIEHGTSPAFVQPALLASMSSRQSHRLGETPWVMQAPVLIDSAAITRGGHANGSQHAAAAGSFLPSESATAKGSWHDPSDPEGMVPAELHYDPQVTAASLIMSHVLRCYLLGIVLFLSLVQQVVLRYLQSRQLHLHVCLSVLQYLTPRASLAACLLHAHRSQKPPCTCHEGRASCAPSAELKYNYNCCISCATVPSRGTMHRCAIGMTYLNSGSLQLIKWSILEMH